MAAARAWRIARRDGAGALAGRVTRKARDRFGTVAAAEVMLDPDDVADSAAVAAPAVPAVTGPLTVGWVALPPGPGSGGHTTMFRIMRSLTDAGHRCVLYLYDPRGCDLAKHTETVHSGWPWLRAELRDAAAGLSGVDALVATSWETAHVLATRAAAVPAHRFYFVQDYEPFFYPVGAQYALAEDTYRFGFHGLTAGGWLADELAARHGMAADAFPFGADTGVYHLDEPLGLAGRGRTGVAFYARPSVARRGYQLGIQALELFARRHPEVEIHLFGDRVRRPPFPATSHGKLSTVDLNRLYNRCHAGLTLSFTNVSLLPWELLAAGAVPVVNDAPHNRRVLSNPSVRWARPTPRALADALHEVVTDPEPGRRAAAASATVQDVSWNAAGRAVVKAIERRCASIHSVG